MDDECLDCLGAWILSGDEAREHVRRMLTSILDSSSLYDNNVASKAKAFSVVASLITRQGEFGSECSAIVLEKVNQALGEGDANLFIKTLIVITELNASLSKYVSLSNVFFLSSIFTPAKLFSMASLCESILFLEHQAELITVNSELVINGSLCIMEELTRCSATDTDTARMLIEFLEMQYIRVAGCLA